MIFIKEKDLFEPVKKFLIDSFSCDAVYAEVGLIDVIGVKSDDVYSVELKTSLNFKVMEQADSNLRCCKYSYIAVPKPKSKHSLFIRNLLKSLGIGLLYVNTSNLKVEVVHYATQSTRRTYDIKKYIDIDYHSRTIGGVKNGDTVSRYGEVINAIYDYLNTVSDWVTVDDILANVPKCSTYYKRPRPSVMSTLRESWNYERFESKKVGKKVYFRSK